MNRASGARRPVISGLERLMKHLKHQVSRNALQSLISGSVT
ncbi:hypothetical protein RD1_3655 [Roseobacter denitrificans OCh 114]|uniref:Uncharacterized protein n=1 Tax=Roseobacter denitrificans (strain ATCC 33942 / OCh 114) TaxID=375451 RepID=Q162G4_ROSDO|nr:hypothetical protein RD1_3655 [Roseobacter denitrificans OCh 114]